MELTSIDGALLFTPRIHEDDRGVFLEWLQSDKLAAGTGHTLNLAQANCSVSRRGVLRGIHFATVPPGQAKYVTCATGAVLDVVVDLRVGSPTFSRWESLRLDDKNRRALYIAEGLGHAFLALTERAVVVYLCSEPYRPDHEHAVHALDPEIGIDWPDPEPVLSPKDAAAHSLAHARASELLPDYRKCLDYYSELGGRR